MKRISLTRYRHQAAILLKEIRKGDPAVLQRLQTLDIFSSTHHSDFVDQARLKHCLNLIAMEQGFEHWASLKADYEARAMEQIASHYAGGYLNHWYAGYAEARSHLESEQGYLLPYRKSGRTDKQQYYVCNNTYIRQFGFDPDAREWQQIGYDMVQPLDRKARLILIDAWIEQRPENRIQRELS